MTKETAETNLDCYFWAYNRRCKVLVVTSFGGHLHYGFRTVDEGTEVIGWIPCDFVGGCELTK